MSTKRTIRDVDANEDVQELLENGYFAEEISFYGCAYVQNHRIYYRIHDDEAALRRFICHAEEGGKIFPTLLDVFYSREKISSGMREEKKEMLRADFLRQLKKDYQPPLFSALMPLAEIPANDVAVTLLEQWRRGLSCCFDPLELQLFEGTIKICRQAKFLKSETYRRMKHWCEDRQIQSYRQYCLSGAFIRQFSGFEYLDQGQWLVFSDADVMVVQRHYADAIKKGRMVTPIVQQKFATDTLRSEDISKQESEFLYRLTNVMDDDYHTLLKQIYDLPTALPREVLQRSREKVERLENTRAQETFYYWLTKWNCRG